MQFKSLTTALILVALAVPSSVMSAPVPESLDSGLEERVVSSRLSKMRQLGAPTSYVPRKSYSNLLVNREPVDLESREPRRGGGRGGRRARRSYVDEEELALQWKGPTATHAEPLKEGERTSLDSTTRGAAYRKSLRTRVGIPTGMTKTRSENLQLEIREPGAVDQALEALKKALQNRKPLVPRLRNKRSPEVDQQLEIREPVRRLNTLPRVTLPPGLLPKFPTMARGFDSVDQD